MNRESLVISLIAQFHAGGAPLEQEDFTEHPDGEWINEGYGWSTVFNARHFAMIPHSGIYTFNPFTPEESRQKLKFQFDAEREAAVLELETRLSKLKKYRMVTTYEYRLVRYANKRADEIILLNDQKYT